MSGCLMLTLVRTEATADRTLGQLLANGEHSCHVLEDTLRPRGVKVAGVTAIPAGLYRVILRSPPSSNESCPPFWESQIFEGIRMHGGNRPEDTEGCPLVAFNRSGLVIHGTAEKELTAKIKDAGGSCLLAIIDHLRTYHDPKSTRFLPVKPPIGPL